MNRLEIIRENGGIPSSGASKDPVSGLLFYVPTAAYTALIGMDDSPFSATQHIVKFGYAEDAESAGLTQSAQNWHVKVIAYHVAEFFRINPKGTLYVGVYERPTGSVAKTYDELELLQAFARGELRQAGVWDGSTTIAATDVTALQSKASKLESEKLVIMVTHNPELANTYATRIINLFDGKIVSDSKPAGGESEEAVQSSTEHAKKSFMSLRTAMSLSLNNLLTKKGRTLLTAFAGSIGIIGIALILSLSNGVNRYIERVRTMDKAVRGVYAALLPKLGGKVYVNPDDGTLRGDTVAMLEDTANEPLREMEKAGELSGYVALIDPEQEVLSSGEVEVVLKQVPTGVMRTIRVKIGFAASV